MEETWVIQPTCDEVRIYSNYFYTEASYDFLYLGDQQYDGEGLCINIVLPVPVTARFTSDGSETRDGFRINYVCTDNSAADGTVSIHYSNSKNLNYLIFSDFNECEVAEPTEGPTAPPPETFNTG